MRLAVAGISIDVDSSVVLFDLEQQTPVFHRSGSSGPEGCSWWINRTACGVATYEQRDDEPGKASGVWMPTRFARRFARPCSKCWPELRQHPSLFPTRRRDRATPQPTQEAL